MLASVSNWFSRTSIPQRRKQRPNGFSFDTYEDRTLLSGVAIYPQPAAAVATESVPPAADPPADFSGHWDIMSVENGTVDIVQEGKKLEIQLAVGIFSDDTHGKVKGNTATAKFISIFESFKIKGKITGTLLDPSSMEGTIFAKLPEIGKVTANFTGSRMIM